MKFIPAFLSLGFFSVLAYWVWTDTIPFELLPENEGNVQTIAKIQSSIENVILSYGAFNVGTAQMMLGAVASLFFVMQKSDET